MYKAIAMMVMLLVVTVVGGCGAPPSSSSGGHDGEHNQPAASGGRELKFTAKEFEFSPKELRLKTGEKVNITLSNTGALEHDLKLDALKIHIHTLPGKTTKGSFTAPTQPGEYEIPCTIAGHKEQGMVLKLIVE
jgi:uncharacterized cupredoxin-like copper-binding protein